MNRPLKIGVILSGCGVFDGSEIQETVITLLCLDQQGSAYQCMAPNKDTEVIDHLTKQPAAGQTRNVLTEAARIARGNILDLAKVDARDYDGFVLPGGFGAAKNLSTFATEGANCSVDPQVARVLQAAHQNGKPIGLICIAPAIGARLFGATLHPKLTIGSDPGTAAALEQMGAAHCVCQVTDFTVDEKHRILSTPAYMEAKSIKDLYPGINKLVTKLAEMARVPVAVR